MKIEPFYFQDFAYVKSKVSSTTLEELKEEAKFILENPNQFKKHNNGLAGNLEKEYISHKSQEILKPYLISLANEFHKHSAENEHYPQWDIKDLWINFQKKYEYNPLHNHAGNLSFVLWVQIPYNLKDELSHSNCVNSNTPSNSLFNFIYTDFMGRIVRHRIDVDKSWEGTMIIFPSSLCHMVHPFYTSDEYRISISGNLVVSSQKNTFSYQ
jgi:hypothetical protein